ncbi:MAG: hypothetical protein L6R39_005773, partial [Caloplaca ligustica]
MSPRTESQGDKHKSPSRTFRVPSSSSSGSQFTVTPKKGPQGDGFRSSSRTFEVRISPRSGNQSMTIPQTASQRNGHANPRATSLDIPLLMSTVYHLRQAIKAQAEINTPRAIPYKYADIATLKGAVESIRDHLDDVLLLEVEEGNMGYNPITTEDGPADSPDNGARDDSAGEGAGLISGIPIGLRSNSGRSSPDASDENEDKCREQEDEDDPTATEESENPDDNDQPSNIHSGTFARVESDHESDNNTGNDD